MNERNSIVLKSVTTPDKIVHSPSFNSINVFHVFVRTQTVNDNESNSNSGSGTVEVTVVATTLQTTPDLSRNTNTTKNMLYGIENHKKTITRVTLEKFDFFEPVVCVFFLRSSLIDGWVIHEYVCDSQMSHNSKRCHSH